MVWRPVTSCDLANPIFLETAVEKGPWKTSCFEHVEDDVLKQPWTASIHLLVSVNILHMYIYYIYDIHIPSCRSMEVIYTNACSCASTFVLGSHFVFCDMNVQLFIFTPNWGRFFPSQIDEVVEVEGRGCGRPWGQKSCYLLLLVVGCLYLVPSQLEQEKQGLYICKYKYIYIYIQIDTCILWTQLIFYKWSMDTHAWRWTQHFRPLPFGSPTRRGLMCSVSRSQLEIQVSDFRTSSV